jgi:hypothetical protein
MKRILFAICRKDFAVHFSNRSGSIQAPNRPFSPMSRILLSSVALAALVALSTIAAGASLGTTTNGGAIITIDGVAAGRVLEWEGGDPRASVVTGPASTDGTATKQPGAPVCAPLVVKCALPPAGPLQDLLAEFCSNKAPRRTIVLTDYDAVGNATGATAFDGAMLDEVHLPALDASNTAPANATFVFTVEQSHDTKPFTATPVSSARATSSMFRLAVDGLDGKGVTRIEPIIVRRGGTSADTAGTSRDYASTSGAVEYSNLSVTLTRASSATWRTWFNDFVINGKSGDEDEKSGALEFLSKDMKQVVFALRFQNMGILRVSRVAVAEGAPELVQAELYFEKLSFGTESTSGDSDPSSQPGTDGTQEDKSGLDGGEETSSDEITGVGEKSLRTLSDAPTTDASGTPTVSVGDRLTLGDVPGSDSASTQTSAGTLADTTSIATTTTTNPADQGTRDPAEFPRVEGLTRVSYTGYFQPTYTQEEASYTTADDIFAVARRVDDAARSAGWSLAQMSEGNSSNGRSVSQRWTRPQAEAWVTFLQPQDGPTQVKVSTTLQKPPAD